MDRKRIFGFTLIELLVVISIISILTIISVSTFNTSKIKARDTQKKADLDSIAKALGSYYADYGEYPEEINWGGAFTDREEGTEVYYYMRVVPENDDNEYRYMVSDDGQSYSLFARMEGESTVTGSYTDDQGETYDYAVPSINSTTIEFCSVNDCTATEGGESSEPTITLAPEVPTNTPAPPTSTPVCRDSYSLCSPNGYNVQCCSRYCCSGRCCGVNIGRCPCPI